MGTFETIEDFKSLAQSRRKLQRYCGRHVNSMLALSWDWKEAHKNPKAKELMHLKLGFKEYWVQKSTGDDQEQEHSPQPSPYPQYLTTTAACLHSLRRCPEELWPREAHELSDVSDPEYKGVNQIIFNPDKLIREFTEQLLGLNQSPLPHEQWKTYGAIGIYTRCRVLSLIINSIDDFTLENLQILSEHIHRIFFQMELLPLREAIGEENLESQEESPDRLYSLERALLYTINKVSENQSSVSRFFSTMQEECNSLLKQITKPGVTQKEAERQAGQLWHPPHAFHTYWAMHALQDYLMFFKKKGVNNIIDPNEVNFYNEVQERIKRWTKSQLTEQISLHQAGSSHLDSDQLGWLLVIYTRFYKDIWQQSVDLELVKTGLSCLFKAQLSDGSWRTYRPIFQYKHGWNAYCYVFETFAELLRNCWAQEARYLRLLLRDYREHLEKLADYADATRFRLNRETRAVGWSSGHHIQHSQEPESWATACVFSFFHQFRRLLALWTKEVALRNLRESREPVTRENAEKTIRERADSWRSLERLSTAEQLLTLFVHPFRTGENPQWETDPDKKLIRKNQPRSAILFGPPGTSKTTLVKNIAYALNWRFIDVRVGDFVAKGYQEIGQTTDEIFSLLMELDHCVVLFDEIDELVQERSTEGAEAFSRFLTTSMLPKLGDLWEQRKILFFVATNHLEYFDEAIKRSQRFDAHLFVSPPSFEKKKCELLKLLSFQPDWQVKLEDIVGDLCAKPQDSSTEERRCCPLHRFIMLRHDQLDELAFRLTEKIEENNNPTINADILIHALERMHGDNIDNAKTECLLEQFQKYENKTYIDFGRKRAWKVDPSIDFTVLRQDYPDETRGKADLFFTNNSFLKPPPLGKQAKFQRGGKEQLGYIVPYNGDKKTTRVKRSKHKRRKTT